MVNFDKYNDRSFSSIVLTMFLIKFLFFLIISHMFFLPTLNPQEQIGFSCNVFLIGDFENNHDLGLKDNSYGEITFTSIAGIDKLLTSLNNIAGCAFGSDDFIEFFNIQYNYEIPYLIKFFLFDLWNYLIFILLVRTVFKI